MFRSLGRTFLVFLPLPFLVASCHYLLTSRGERRASPVDSGIYEPIVDPAALLGAWKYNGNCRIEVDGAGLIVVNEWGSRARATLAGRKVEVPEWRSSANISGDLQTLYWSSGAAWKR